MNRKLSTKQQLSHKVIIFWSMIGLLTLVFIITILTIFFRNSSPSSIDDLTNLREDHIFRQEGTYYVYVYSKIGITEEKAELDKASDLEELITNYMTYAKRNSQANRLYGMIVDSTAGNYGNHSCLFEGTAATTVLNKTQFDTLQINKADIPILLLIKDGRVTGAYLTEREIRQELELQMNP